MKEMGRAETKMNESEETGEIKKPSPSTLTCYMLQGQQAFPNCKPISVGRPGDVKYTTRLSHPTTRILGYQKNFRGTQKRVRISHVKRVIGVQVIEVLL